MNSIKKRTYLMVKKKIDIFRGGFASWDSVRIDWFVENALKEKADVGIIGVDCIFIHVSRMKIKKVISELIFSNIRNIVIIDIFKKTCDAVHIILDGIVTKIFQVNRRSDFVQNRVFSNFVI